MNFIEEIKNRAKNNIKRIILPETMDKRVLKAAEICTKENIAKVYTLQCLSVGRMQELYKEKDWGLLINHEITESFQGGVISSETNVPGRDENGVINSSIYKKAHAAATPQPFTIGASWLHH